MKASKILLLEDNAQDVELIRHALQNGGCHAQVRVVRTGAEFRAAMAEGGFDMILADYAVPDIDGETALALRNELYPEMPFVIVSGTLGEEAAVELFHRGVTDCIFKTQLARLAPAVLRAARENVQKVERQQLEQTSRARTNLLQLQQVIAVAANEAESVTEALQSGIDLICAYANFSIGHAFVINPRDYDTLDSANVWHLEDETRHEAFREETERLRFRAGEGLPGAVLASNNPIWVENLRELSDFRRAKVAGELDLKTSVAFPIRSGKTVVAVLEFFSHKIMPANQRLLDVMVYVGTQLGRVLERERAELVLRERTQHLAEAQRLTALGSWEIDLVNLDDVHHNPLRWSDEVFRIFGYAPGEIEVSSENFFRSVHPDDQEAIRAAIRAAIETGAEYSIDHRIILPDGTERFVHEQSRIIYDVTGRPLKMAGVVQDITDRRRNELALRESEERFRATFEQAAVGLLHLGLDGHFLRVNQRFCDLLGYSREELRDMYLREVMHPEDALIDSLEFNQLLTGDLVSHIAEKRCISKTGTVIWTNVTTALLRDTQGAPAYFISVVEDISDRKRLEQQYLQAQKMEAFGRLAGGVAHDFNNLLTVISGYNSILLEDLPSTDPRRDYVEQVGKAAERAAALTNQLLAFSRQQVLQPKVFHPNAVLEDVEKMLVRIIGEDVELITEFDAEVGHVRADVSQIETVLVNMAVNARDAMPRGGTLTIRTTNFTATEEIERVPGMPAGAYVCITVSDTGAGMSEEVQARIFEPFFTTKPVGQGTGLGLATCYGIVSQSGGYIAVDSERGRGTTFAIYLPSVEDVSEESVQASEFRELPRGTETILVVEDEDMVRKLTSWVLTALGYHVMEAANGEDAFNLLQTHKGQPLHLVVTDVVMPQMSGKDLAFWIRAAHPDAKILFMSGYPNHELDDTSELGGHVEFLRKPFVPKELARKVRAMLDEEPGKTGHEISL